MSVLTMVAFADPAWRGLDEGNYYSGPKITAEDLSGKVVFVDCWGYRCGPCRNLLPKMELLWKKNKNKPFVLIGNHCQAREPSEVMALVKQNRLSYPIYQGAGIENRPDSGGRLPFMYVVDHRGKVVYSGRDINEAEKAVSKALDRIGKLPSLCSGFAFKKYKTLEPQLVLGKPTKQIVAKLSEDIKKASANSATPSMRASAEEARQLLEAIEMAKNEIGKDIESLAQGNPQEALKLAKAFMVSFPEDGEKYKSLVSEPGTQSNSTLVSAHEADRRPMALQTPKNASNAQTSSSGKADTADETTIISESSTMLYMVVDISPGPEASAYKVSFLDDVPPDGWTDEYKTSKIVFRHIPAGTFTMGAPAGEIGQHSAKQETLHEVTLTHDFWIGIFEVTQRQWELVMGTRPSQFSNPSDYATRPVENVSFNDIRGMSMDLHKPLSDAVDSSCFIGRMRNRTELHFDLPTEAQWEYACRAGTSTALNSGKNLSNAKRDGAMGKVGRYLHNGGVSAKVGSYEPNAFGIYDMHGNVWEMCLDQWWPYLGTVSVTDPFKIMSIPRKKSATADEMRHVIRGGSFFNDAGWCRAAGPRAALPKTSERSGKVGLRVLVLPVKPSYSHE